MKNSIGVKNICISIVGLLALVMVFSVKNIANASTQNYTIDGHTVTIERNGTAVTVSADAGMVGNIGDIGYSYYFTSTASTTPYQQAYTLPFTVYVPTDVTSAVVYVYGVSQGQVRLPNPYAIEPNVVSLQQFTSDGITPIAEHATTTGSTVVFKATISATSTNPVAIEVEVRRAEEPFTGIDDGYTLRSEVGLPGAQVTLTATNLNGGAYHWRIRTVDATSSDFSTLLQGDDTHSWSGAEGHWGVYLTNHAIPQGTKLDSITFKATYMGGTPNSLTAMRCRLSSTQGDIKYDASSVTEENGFVICHWNTPYVMPAVDPLSGQYVFMEFGDATTDSTRFILWGGYEIPAWDKLHPGIPALAWIGGIPGNGVYPYMHYNNSTSTIFSGFVAEGNISDWQEFGTVGDADFIVEMPLAFKAVELAKLVIGAPYLGDGKTWGGKGWDSSLSSYVEPNTIFRGYNYWDNSLKRVTFGSGLDCSGLVQWAYNRAFDSSKSLKQNAIRYDSADGQYINNSDPLTEDMKPGDLLFLDKNSDGLKDHVAIYVGDNGFFDIVEAFSPKLGVGIIGSKKVEFEGRVGFTPIQDVRRMVIAPPLRGSLQAGSPINLAVTDPDGLTITATTLIQTDEEYLREIPGELYYSQSEIGPDGRPEDLVYWPTQKIGNYVVKVTPQDGASATSTYSLTFRSGSATIQLAQDIPLNQIPSQGYGIELLASDTISTFIPVSIDIKPDSTPNSINLGSNGVVPVAIFGSATFDAYQIDPATIKLANASAKLKGNSQPMTSYSDINNDGFMDIIIQISTQALQLSSDDIKANLDGQLLNGTLFKGLDSVRIIQ